MAPLVRRSWSVRGQTPVLHQRGRCLQKVSAIAALCISPTRDRLALYFRLHPDANVNAERAMDFLEHLQRQLRTPVVLIWDRFQATRASFSINASFPAQHTWRTCRPTLPNSIPSNTSGLTSRTIRWPTIPPSIFIPSPIGRAAPLTPCSTGKICCALSYATAVFLCVSDRTLLTHGSIVAKHPHLLSVNRVTWALRCRAVNGLSDAVFDSPCGELLIHEPSFLAWFLGLGGRAKPRTGRMGGRRLSALTSIEKDHVRPGTR